MPIVVNIFLTAVVEKNVLKKSARGPLNNATTISTKYGTAENTPLNTTAYVPIDVKQNVCKGSLQPTYIGALKNINIC